MSVRIDFCCDEMKRSSCQFQSTGSSTLIFVEIREVTKNNNSSFYSAEEKKKKTNKKNKIKFIHIHFPLILFSSVSSFIPFLSDEFKTIQLDS